MSLLIDGMEMPKDEIYLRIDEKGEVYVYGSYPTELYKAVPVPPHGRLIDADNLLNTAFKLVDEETFRAFRQIVLDVPTIIQTSEEVYNVYNNTVGNLHWTGTHSGEHIIQLEESE